MILKNGTVFVDGKYENVDVKIQEEIIIDIQPWGGSLGSQNRPGDALDDEVIDCTGMKVLPGFIDLHTHGCLSYDFSISSVEEMGKMCEFYARHGVTSILATTMSNEEQTHRDAMGKIREAMKRQKDEWNVSKAMKCQRDDSVLGQASIEGIYMEGPFFGTSKSGAHKKSYLKPISQQLIDEYQELSGNSIRIVAVDPTLENAMKFIEHNHKGFSIALAHTNCSYEVAKKAIKAGARQVTHVFNGMSPLHHREPGLIGAASHYHLNTEIICDGIHVHPAVVEMMFKAMPDQMILISDSINPTGMAKALHLEDTIGRIGIGKRADLLLVSEKFELNEVILRGKCLNIHHLLPLFE